MPSACLSMWCQSRSMVGEISGNSSKNCRLRRLALARQCVVQQLGLTVQDHSLAHQEFTAPEWSDVPQSAAALPLQPPPGLERPPAILLETLCYAPTCVSLARPSRTHAAELAAELCAELELHTITFSSCVSLAREAAPGTTTSTLAGPCRSLSGSPTHHQAFGIGGGVLLRGLTSQTGRTWNLRNGTVTHALDSRTGRVGVVIDGDSASRSIRVENLIHISNRRGTGTNVMGEQLERQQQIRLTWRTPQEDMGPVDALVWCPLAQAMLLLERKLGPLRFEFMGREPNLLDSPGPLLVSEGQMTNSCFTLF